MTIHRVAVTPEQFGQLEVAWFFCAYPGKRRIAGERIDQWRESVNHILGFEPEGDWSPVIAEGHHERDSE